MFVIRCEDIMTGKEISNWEAPGVPGIEDRIICLDTWHEGDKICEAHNQYVVETRTWHVDNHRHGEIVGGFLDAVVLKVSKKL